MTRLTAPSKTTGNLSLVLRLDPDPGLGLPLNALPPKTVGRAPRRTTQDAGFAPVIPS